MRNYVHSFLFVLLACWSCLGIVGCSPNSGGSSGASSYPAASGNTYDSSSEAEARREALRQGHRENTAIYNKTISNINAAEAAANRQEQARQADAIRNPYRP